MDIRKMRYFITAAEKGSFTKAADIHYISQTAISQQMASMENELDAKLFDRTGYRIQLTMAGKVFLEECKEIVKKYDSAASRVRDISQGVQGSLHIGFSGFGDRELLLDTIQAFQAEYPGINLTFVSDTITGLQSKLENADLDLVFGFSYDFQPHKNIRRQILLNDEVGLIVSPKHPLSATKTAMNPIL